MTFFNPHFLKQLSSMQVHDLHGFDMRVSPVRDTLHTNMTDPFNCDKSPRLSSAALSACLVESRFVGRVDKMLLRASANTFPR